MKIFDIKVMSLIIILIFCLSPLSAIDLNGNNSTAIDDDNNNTDLAIEDANSNGIKDIKVSEVKDDKENEPIDPELSVYVPDVDPAEETLIEVKSNNKYAGWVEVKVDGVKISTFYLSRGYANVLIYDELLPGEHTVEAISQGNDDFLDSEANTTFKVSNTPKIYAFVNDVTGDEILNVGIRTAEQYNGLVAVVLEDGTTQYGYAKKGRFSCQFNHTECFTDGFHDVKIIVIGDDVFSRSEIHKSFHVN